jgi:hypothetical protein
MIEALLIAGAAFVAWKIFEGYPAGQGPFDHLPAGLTRANASGQPEKVTASSGRSYVTYTWPPDSNGALFHVAERTGAKAWIAYSATQQSGAPRTLYALRTPYKSGSPEDVAESTALKADFGVH